MSVMPGSACMVCVFNLEAPARCAHMRMGTKEHAKSILAIYG